MNPTIQLYRTRLLDQAIQWAIACLWLFITFGLATGAFAQAVLSKQTVSPSAQPANPVLAASAPATAHPAGATPLPTSAPTVTPVLVPKKLSLDEALGPLNAQMGGHL